MNGIAWGLIGLIALDKTIHAIAAVRGHYSATWRRKPDKKQSAQTVHRIEISPDISDLITSTPAPPAT